MKAEVLHWWTSGGELAAVKVFADRFTAAGGTWVDTAIAGGQNARTAGINRIVGGNPPTAMQFNTGKQFDELVANELLSDLDDVAAAGKWREVLPPAIIEAATRDGKFYAVPVNIHGIDWLWYNKQVFADAGIAEPKTWPEVLAAAQKLKEKGIIGLAQGGQPWQERTLFNSVLVGYGGTELFYRLYRDNDVDAVNEREVQGGGGAVQAASDHGRPGQPGAQLERRHRHGDHRQGRDAAHGRLGQGRVQCRRADRRQGVWLRRRRRGRLSDGRRRVRLPDDQRRRRREPPRSSSPR